MQRFIFKFVILISLTSSAFADEIFVQVRSTKLRAAPQHYAATVDSLKLGNSLTVLKKDGAWIQAKTKSGKTGYIHESAVSERQVTLSGARGSGSKSDKSDVVLAGKGFSKEVEREFAINNPNISFASVDAMERIAISDSDVRAFINAGGLNING